MPEGPGLGYKTERDIRRFHWSNVNKDANPEGCETPTAQLQALSEHSLNSHEDAS